MMLDERTIALIVGPLPVKRAHIPYIMPSVELTFEMGHGGGTDPGGG